MNKKHVFAGIILFMLSCLLFSGCSKPGNGGEPRIAQFIADLDSPDLEVRREAIYQLKKSPTELGAQKETVVIALRKRFLGDNDFYARWYAAIALREIDFTNNKDFILSSLLEEIEGPSAEVRAYAAYRLWPFVDELSENEKETAINSLTKHLRDENAMVRYAAAISLGRINPVLFQDLILPLLVSAIRAPFGSATIPYFTFTRSPSPLAGEGRDGGISREGWLSSPFCLFRCRSPHLNPPPQDKMNEPAAPVSYNNAGCSGEPEPIRI